MRTHLAVSLQNLLRHRPPHHNSARTASAIASWSSSRPSCSSSSPRTNPSPNALWTKHRNANDISYCHNVSQTKQLSTTPHKLQDAFLPDKIVRCLKPDLDLPEDQPLHQMVFDKCDEFKDLPALSDVLTGRSYTYNQLKDTSIRVASALSKKGYKKGDIILAFSPNQIDYTVLMLASSCLGVWFCAANPSFNAEELARQIHISDSIAVFVHPVLAGVADQALGMENFPHQIKDKFVFGESSGYEPFQRLREDDGKAFPDVSISPTKDVLVLPYSSGTTGLPKGVMLSHYNVVANTLQILNVYRFNVSDNVLGLLPLYHIYGMVVVQFGALFAGAHLHLLPKFEPESFLTCMQDKKICSANLVPPLVLFLTKHPLVNKFDLSPLKSVICGAAPLGKDITDAFVERFNNQVTVQQGYGLTEMSPVTHFDSVHRHGSVGHPVTNTLAKVVDVDSWGLCGVNEEGEVCVKGPQKMLGYYKNEVATNEMIKADGWLYTGDIGYYDQEGVFYISDRLKELIKYKGSQVAPAELEAILIGHPEVADVCVIGIPDERAGEVPKAFVVKKPDSTVSDETLIQYVGGQVTDYKQLRGGVEFIQEIPKNPSGKILRRLLK